MQFTLGMDIGGSHASAALSDGAGRLFPGSLQTQPLQAHASASRLLDQLAGCLLKSVGSLPPDQGPVKRIGLAMPGPFDYERGISRIRGLHKFDRLFGTDVRLSLFQRLQAAQGLESPELYFLNDAAAFLKGAVRRHRLEGRLVIGITLGTGIGSAFYQMDQLVTDGPAVPPRGFVYQLPFLDGIAEDYLGSHWLQREYGKSRQQSLQADEIARLARQGDQPAQQVFAEYGKNLALLLHTLLEKFPASVLVLGGGLLHAYDLFEAAFVQGLERGGAAVPELLRCEDTRELAISGAALYAEEQTGISEFRRSSPQPLLPMMKPALEKGDYDLYPAHSLRSGVVQSGWDDLARLAGHARSLLVDGFTGVDWQTFFLQMIRALGKQPDKINFLCVDAALRPTEEIEYLIGRRLNSDGPDSIFGSLADFDIREFFDSKLLQELRADEEALTILYGSGATLCGWKAPVCYIDLPKNELQYRSRAGGIRNLGGTIEPDPRKQYKRFYYIDWPVLNRHRASLLPQLSLFIDGQQRQAWHSISGDDFRQALRDLSRRNFRVRPWFEPGAWGGRWMLEHFKGLSPEVPNYAWSFELIAPENGLLLEQEGRLLECSFDWLMIQEAEDVMGKAYPRYGSYFPLRFDFLDTMQGGNLSIQVHPLEDYMTSNFGEPITQDETYYILESDKDAVVYLGFREGVDPAAFEAQLRRSEQSGEPMQVTDWVQALPAAKHDLFLIPAGTIHGAGRNNLVLEISSTPYIYTFKLYDWQRADLDGKPRPINIGHGMRNLDFSRAGKRVQKELLSSPSLLEKGEGYERWLLPTHQQHPYRVERVCWKGSLEIDLEGNFQVAMLVKGKQVKVITGSIASLYHYGETFVIPAGAQRYRLELEGEEEAMLVLACMKDPGENPAI